MKSYRQKLIYLAKIYRIKQILDHEQNLSSYQIEVILLKNKVPIPSGRSLIGIRLDRILVKPFINSIRSIFEFFAKTNKNINLATNRKINNFFYTISFIFRSIGKLFIFIGNTIVDFLNNIYNFKVKEDSFNKIISRTGVLSLLLVIGFSLFYLKEFVSSVDSFKISFEIKSEKSNKSDEKNTKQAGKTNINKSKPEEAKPEVNTLKKETAKLPTKKETVKKPSEKKKNPNSFGLNTETVLNLFEDLEYDLKKVRLEKEVKPIYFTRFPMDLNSISSTQLKKDTFIKIVLPLVLAENDKIIADRQKLESLIKKKMTNDKEKEWLRLKLREYKVKNSDFKNLLEKIDIIPTSIALAQAAKESGWGTSRFALEGNAIFGQWTWNGKGIEPQEKVEGKNHKILKFPILRASVKAYITNLNTHKGYKNFRKKRSKLRNKNANISGLDLIHELDNYAETGKEYTRTLEKIIVQNNLSDFEETKLLEKSIKSQLTL